MLLASEVLKMTNDDNRMKALEKHIVRMEEKIKNGQQKDVEIV